MSVKIRIKRGFLYLDVIQNRMHSWEALHIKLSENALVRKEQMKQAEICRAKRELQLSMNEWNLQDTIAGRETLISYMRKMADGLSVNNPFVSGIKCLEKHYDKGNIQLRSINAKWVDDYQKWLLSIPSLSQTTASYYAGAIRTALNKAVRDKILTSNPADTVKVIPRLQADKPTLTIEEIQKISELELDGEHEKECQRAFLFACNTGLRISDLSTLEWSHIEKRDLGKYNKYSHWIFKKQIKTENQVEIPLNNIAYSLIEPYEQEEGFIFPMLAKNILNSNRTIKRIAEKAGIKKNITWHTARRTFATLELESGADPFTVQRLMGHRKISMTAIYAKSNNIKSSAIDGLEKMLINKDKEQ